MTQTKDYVNSVNGDAQTKMCSFKFDTHIIVAILNCSRRMNNAYMQRTNWKFNEREK